MKVLAAFIFTLLTWAFVNAQNEQAPVVDREFEYKSWTYQDVRSSEKIDLRDAVKGKKLVMVVYFAAWCPNWKHEAPFAQAMYEKYRSDGLGVIGVSEYETLDATKNGLDSLKVTFPVVYESQARDAKKTTLHYQYRTAVGDTRSWGSPWNIFILPQNVEIRGDVLTRKAPVVNGELIETDVERFIREKLGLGGVDKMTGVSEKKNTDEPCDPEKPSTSLKKP
jgi:peroxiredoxin